MTKFSIHNYYNRTSKRLTCSQLYPRRPQRLNSSYWPPVTRAPYRLPYILFLGIFHLTVLEGLHRGEEVLEFSLLFKHAHFFPGSPSVRRERQTPPTCCTGPLARTCLSLLLLFPELGQNPRLIQNDKPMVAI